MRILTLMKATTLIIFLGFFVAFGIYIDQEWLLTGCLIGAAGWSALWFIECWRA